MSAVLEDQTSTAELEASTQQRKVPVIASGLLEDFLTVEVANDIISQLSEPFESEL